MKLQTALDTCRAAELAKEQVKAIESPPEERIAAVRFPQRTAGRAPSDSDQGEHRPASISQGSSPCKCSRCGCVHGSKRCPASGKPCHNCKVIGHFAAMCMTKPKAKVQSLHSAPGVPMPEERDVISGVETPSDDQSSLPVPSFHVGTVVGAGSSWQMPMMTNGVAISFKLDTGAQVNIFPCTQF